MLDGASWFGGASTYDISPAIGAPLLKITGIGDVVRSNTELIDMSDP
jgi:hypothetical protein